MAEGGGANAGGEYLLINGSPRRAGNSAFLLDRAGKALLEADPGARIALIRLSALAIGPCRACDACRLGTRKYCVIDDDMAPLYPRIASAKAILISSPVYWFSFTAQLKLFMDRLYGLWIERENPIRGIPYGGIFAYGDDDEKLSGVENVIASFRDCVRYLGGELAGIVKGTASGPGDAARDPRLISGAEELGRTTAALVQGRGGV